MDKDLECPFDEGDLISCVIEGTMLEGKIHYENNCIFICQDVTEGMGCSNQLGYMYAWVVCGVSKKSTTWNVGCDTNGVDNVRLICSNKIKFKIGDKVRVISNIDNYSERSIGECFIIEEVTFDGWYREDKGVSDGIKAKSLELVSKAKKIRKKKRKTVITDTLETVQSITSPSFILSVGTDKREYFSETKDESIEDLLNKRK